MNAEQAKRIAAKFVAQLKLIWRHVPPPSQSDIRDFERAFESIDLAEPVPEGAVKLRIPVLIDASGKWFAQSAHDYQKETDEEARYRLEFEEVVDASARLFWIEAYAPPVAPVPVVKGAVAK